MIMKRVVPIICAISVYLSFPAISYAQDNQKNNETSSQTSSDKQEESTTEQNKSDDTEEDNKTIGEDVEIIYFNTKDDNYVSPPVNPLPSYYRIHKKPALGENIEGIAPPVNPLPDLNVIDDKE